MKLRHGFRRIVGENSDNALGLQHAANDVHNVGGVGLGLHVLLGHFQLQAAGNGAAELFDAVAELLSMAQLALDVGGQRLLDEIGPHPFHVQTVGQIVDDRLNLHVEGLAEAGDDLVFGSGHAKRSPLFGGL